MKQRLEEVEKGDRGRRRKGPVRSSGTIDCAAAASDAAARGRQTGGAIHSCRRRPSAASLTLMTVGRSRRLERQLTS